MAKKEIKYEWNQDTVDHFKLTSAYTSKGDVIREIYRFIEADCTLEIGDTEEILAKDLTNKVFGTLKTTTNQRKKNYDKGRD